MFDFITTAASGGLTGLLGMALTDGIKLFRGRQEHKQELEMRELDIRIAQQEAQAALAQTAQTAEMASDQARWSAMTASLSGINERWSRPGDGGAMVFVDVARGLIRPLLTIALVAATLFVYVTSTDPLLVEQITQSIIYLTCVAVTWWFGDRYNRKK